MAQYVPVSKTLKSLFLDDPRFFILIQNEYQSEAGVYAQFQDGSKFKLFPLTCDSNTIVVHLQLYCDGVGLTNAISPASGNHSSTMFYILILNLPPKYYADLSHIFLIAMCNSSDIKEVEGQNSLLNAIVNDLSDLETTGFELEVPSKGKFKVFAVVSQFTGDNLALNQIFGLTESFSHDYFCPICYCTREESQNNFLEKDFQLRTRTPYEFDLEQLEFLEPGSLHFRGIKRACMLNRLLYFHIILNWVNDCMHTVLQGFGPYVCALVIKTFINQKLFNITELNDAINKVFSSLRVEKKIGQAC